jgi:hypothetical protein
MAQYIGEKEVKSVVATEEKTPGGVPIMKVTYADDVTEHFSQYMYDAVLTEEPCNAEVLRDRRISPVVALVLTALREWGVKLGELGYLSALLNRSLDFNKDAALNELWSKWMPKPLSTDDVDLIVIDRVLRSKEAKTDATNS